MTECARSTPAVCHSLELAAPSAEEAIRRTRQDRDTLDAHLHQSHNSGIDCYLLTVTPKKFTDGHCVLLFYLDGKWHVNDYMNVYEGFETPEEAIEDYNKLYFTEHKDLGPIVFNGLVEYNIPSHTPFFGDVKISSDGMFGLKKIFD